MFVLVRPENHPHFGNKAVALAHSFSITVGGCCVATRADAKSGCGGGFFDPDFFFDVLRGFFTIESHQPICCIVLGPEWLKPYDDNPVTLAPNLDLSVEDAKRIWPL